MDFNEARDDWVAVVSAGPLQIIYRFIQTDNHASTSSLNFTGQMLFMTPNQKCQSTESNYYFTKNVLFIIYLSSEPIRSYNLAKIGDR